VARRGGTSGPSCMNCGVETDARALGCEASVGGGRGGYLPIASTPGLGITLDPGALARDSHGEKELDAEHTPRVTAQDSFFRMM